MEKVFCLISLILVSELVGVSSLQCYVCVDCPNPNNDQLKTCGPVTTVAPATDSNTTEDPAGNTTTDSNTTEDPAGKTTTDSPGNGAGNNDPSYGEENGSEGGRAKRSVLSTGNSKNGCYCEDDTECDCDEDSIFNRVSSYADGDYLCVEATIKVNDTDTIVRDCTTSVFEGQAPCDYLNATYTASACKTCNTDKCNGSYAVQYSFVMLLGALCVMLFK